VLPLHRSKKHPLADVAGTVTVRVRVGVITVMP
jgi:hypothetical protein